MDSGNRKSPLVSAVKWLASVLLGRVTLPAWLAIGMAIFLGVPAWSDAVRFRLETAKTTSGLPATLAPIITYPYFPGGLAVFGLVYLILVGYSGSDVVRHKLVPVVGWIVIGVVLVSVIITAGNGYFEIRVREEANKVALGIPRNTPDVNNPNKPQTPLTQGVGIPTPDQSRILLLYLKKLDPEVKDILFTRTPNDNYA